MWTLEPYLLSELERKQRQLRAEAWTVRQARLARESQAGRSGPRRPRRVALAAWLRLLAARLDGAAGAPCPPIAKRA